MNRDEKVRLSAVAGMFYPLDAAELAAAVDSFVANAEIPSTLLQKSRSLRAIVAPHAGYAYSGAVAGKGYALVKKAASERRISRVILLGPSHSVWLEGAALSAAAHWKTPLGKVAVAEFDPGSKTFVKSDIAHRDEHCLEVQLPFLQRVLGSFEIIPILIGEAGPEEIAKAISPHIDDATMIIASSDLSHYHPYAKAVELDSKANKAIPAGDISAAEKIEACGKSAILALMAIAKAKGWKGEFVAYANSGDAVGEKSEVVGYGCYAWFG